MVEAEKEWKIILERERRKYEWYLRHWAESRKRYHPHLDAKRHDHEPPKELSFDESDVADPVAPDQNPPSF